MTPTKKAVIGFASFFVATIASAQSGVASVYSSGRVTATGARFNPHCMCAASKSLPLGSHARVVNRRTGRSITVLINDRGPFVRGRIIDLTPVAARALGISGLGLVSVN